MIGVIADDFTGGTDVAVFFRRSGLRTLILFGIDAGSDIHVRRCDEGRGGPGPATRAR
jgi:uncharacterized protein YgbK (DUF1537 family)